MRGLGGFFAGTSRFPGGFFSQATCASLVKKGGIIVFLLGNSVGIIGVGEYISNFMPQWKSAVDASDPFNPNGYVLNDWGKFLIDHHSSFNQMWWQWSFDRMRADPMVVKGLS